jgi:hypothetical protein
MSLESGSDSPIREVTPGAALCAGAMDALVAVHEGHSLVVEHEPLVEPACVGELVAELGPQRVQREEAANPEQIVAIHAPILLA